MANWIRGLALVAGLFTTALAGPAGAGETQPSAEARALISRQFDAFARDDAAGAYALVTPGLKTTFTDPDVFMGMVRSRYAPVYRHRDVDFGDAEVDDDAITIAATLVDSDSQVWTALYTLERQPDGQWLINSCKLIKLLESALSPRDRTAFGASVAPDNRFGAEGGRAAVPGAIGPPRRPTLKRLTLCAAS